MTAPSAPPAPEGDAGESADAWFEGSGIVSSYRDVGTAVDEQDAAGVAWAAAAAGLGTLGFVADPFGSLTSAFAGWAIEHLWFLREPLDALAGDPQEVGDLAAGWQRLSHVLTAQGTAARTAVEEAGRAWEGAAAAGFAGTTTAVAAGADRISEQARATAELVLHTGAMVGAERALIRDAVADFLAGLATSGVLTAISGGAAAPVTVTNALLDAVQLGRRLGDRVQTLVDALRESAELAGRAETALHAAIGRPDRAVEHGKQEAAARASAAGGDDPAPE
ncbi:hypothetical protein AD006_06340 [Pseudonocardia sp. EC080610-09]|uniref:WXG100-like domain-containing protein n=1 Tax=unclassified Pseudonocardia TaxID=2619320 RepID=UPI0006CB689A|nr:MULTISPECIES: hypothetical protein [unclassified Pseudonocardia]ALE75645.1 hypothetical protein FRP1_27160 [Pseudonocardia sp. EC080625-04]ALL75021.1 hypothetical protein AD006_06340 [Pseudonocardia sp. EC080610-09]ALL82042.1 hypothetical protein AD017_14155 [Pseudonocardia sp. EC080619-01]